MEKLQYDGPVVLAIMDGAGLSNQTAGNAVRQAHIDFINSAWAHYPHLVLQASGPAVGLAEGQMGNSEVGHNAIGSGQIIKQGVTRVDAAFESGSIWRSSAWYNIIDKMSKPGSTLHFAGIFSDGGVHSHIRHLEQLISQAYKQGIRRIRVHCVFDGRDVAPQSEPKYIDRLEAFFRQFPDADFKIASGAGRMVAVADRYGTDWNMVKIGWDMMVHGKTVYQFNTANEAISYFRRQNPELQDQYIPAFIVMDAKHQPVGRVIDGDVVVYYDFRADRALEIAQAFTYNDFPYFDREERPNVYFVGMNEYDIDTHVPEHTFIPPIHIDNTLSQLLGQTNTPQLAISETAKFGHITYYFNGNSYNRSPREDFLEIKSDTQPFDTRPWMKSAEITDAVLANIKKYKFIRINFPNGDMVGHFAELEPTIAAMEAVDIQLRRIAAAVDRAKGMLIITADHGNAEELIDANGQPKTAHSTNPVPCIFYDNTDNRSKYQLVAPADAGLSNLASTIALLLGHNQYPESWRPPLIKL